MAQRLGERFFKLGVVSYDSRYADRLQLCLCLKQTMYLLYLAETSAEKLLCELLLSSIYNKTEELVSNIHFSHYSVQFSTQQT